MKTKNKINQLLVRFYRKSTKFNLNLTVELQEIVTGLMLGDLFAEKAKPRSNTRLQFKQSLKNKEYIDHLYLLFKDYTSSPPKAILSKEKRKNRSELNVSVKFWTLSLPCFNKYRELFYDNSGKKFIPLNLEEILTARGLAYWLMDDGYNSLTGFYFCTESYSLEDNHKLCLILKNKFNLNCSVHKHTNGYRLYVLSSSKEDLLSLVKPNLIKHFYYKFKL